MSHFCFPRLYLQGDYCFNPSTSNNDVITPQILDLVPPFEGPYTSDSNAVEVPHPDWTDERLQKYIIGTFVDPNRGTLINGQWNPFGDMAFWFQNVKIVASELRPNQLLNSPEQDSIVGAQVELTKAVMIDLNPEGFNTSQLFADNFVLRGSEDALGKTGTYISRKPTRADTKWINPYRNLTFHGTAGSSGEAGGLSASFFTAWEVDPADLDTSGMDLPDNVLETQNSPAMQAIINELRTNPNARGLQLRLNLYLTYPLISDADLKAYFDKGDFRDNPAFGKLVGCISVWYDQELTSMTMGRFLNWQEKFKWRVPVPGQPDATGAAFLAPIVAQYQPSLNVVTLDVGNTFPETSQAGQKYNMGDLQLKLMTPGFQEIPLGTLTYAQYGTQNYLQRGGMIDVPVQPGVPITDFTFLFLTYTDPETRQETRLLFEDELMFGSDDGCVYTSQEAIARNQDPMLTVSIFSFGQPLARQAAAAYQVWTATPTGEPTPDNDPGPYKYIPPTSRAKSIIQVNGAVYRTRVSDLPIQSGPAVYSMRLAPYKYQDVGINIVTDNLVNVRLLPLDDFSHIPDEQLTWEVIFTNVFRYYYIVLPAMNRHLDMKEPSNWYNPAAAVYLIMRTNEELFEYYSYMPRTRDLSEGKRILVWRWCIKTLREFGYTIGPWQVSMETIGEIRREIAAQLPQAERARLGIL